MKANFSFTYPLKHKVVRDLKVVTEHVGDLAVEGVGHFNKGAGDLFDRYTVDIDFVRWQGHDIKAVLEVVGAMEDITEAATRHFAETIES